MRDEIAIAAMTACMMNDKNLAALSELARRTEDGLYTCIAKSAYGIADAMMRVRAHN